MNRLALAVVLALLLVAVPLGILATAPAVGQSDDGNTTDRGDVFGDANNSDPAPYEVTETSNGGPYSLDELRDGGREIPGADPSTRWVGDGVVFVDYPSTNPLGPQAEEWEVENILASGALVEADELTVHAQRGRDARNAEYTLKVVTYTEGKVTVVRGGQPIDAEAGVNQSVHEHSLTFSGAFDRETVSLPNTDGETREVAMWLEDSRGERVDGAQWSFSHRSTPTSTDPGISTTGGLYLWTAIFVLAPATFGTLGAFAAGRKMLAKTGRGPMLPGWLYGFAAFGVGLMILLFGWHAFAVLITEMPWLLGASLAVVVFIGYVETAGGDTIRALFERSELVDVQSPDGELVPDVLYEDQTDVQLCRLDDDGRYVVVKPGIRPFLARWLGVAPTLDVSELRTEIRTKGARWDKKFIADPSSEGALTYEHPRLRFPLARETADGAGFVDRLGAVRWSVVALSLVAAGAGWAIGGAMGLPRLGLLTLGLATFAYLASEVENGGVEFEPAPVHYRRARPTALTSAKEVSDAKTTDALEKVALEAQTDTVLDAMRIAANRDRTVTERMHAKEFGYDTDETTHGGRGGAGDDDGANNPHDRPERRDDDETDETGLVPHGG